MLRLIDVRPMVFTWRRCGGWLLGSFALGGLFAAPGVSAQEPCRSYRIVEHMVYENRPVTSWRLETKWVTEEREVTDYVDSWVTEYETIRSYKPVFETQERVETRVVRKPVTETRVETRYRDVVEYETVTEEREEVVSVPKTIRETLYRDEQRIERVPVVRTYTQNETVTTLRPVTSYHNQVVDQGGYVDQIVQRPATVSNRLQWMPPAWNYDPATGANYYQRRGLYWVPTVTPSPATVQRTYVPNLVNQQIPVTQYVPETHVQQRPVQVTEYEDRVTTTRIPYEQVRTEFEQQVVRRPVTVQRPVTRRVTEEVPVTETRYVEQEIQVPVRTQNVTYQVHEEQRPVQVRRRVPQVRKITVEKPVQEWVEVKSTQRVGRIVTERIPLDINGNPIRVAPATPAAPETIEGTPSGAAAPPSGAAAPPANPTPAAPADTPPSITPAEADKALELKGADGSEVME